MRQGQQVMPGPATVTPPYGATSKVTGRLDQQTLLGKLPDTIRKIARDAGVPVWAVCGRCDLPEEKRSAFDRIIALSDLEPDPETSMVRAGSLLSRAVEEAVRQESAG